MSASAIKDRPATYADVLAAPADKVAELVNGALHVQPRPVMRHGHASSSLFGELYQRRSGGDQGGWIFVVEPELHLGEDILVPDIAGWRVATLGDPAQALDVAYMELAPDWVCEVPSPSTRAFDLTEKREIYRRAAVPHIWFVDPLAKTLEAFENREGEWVLTSALCDQADVCIAPFEAFSFPLKSLWLPGS